MSSTEADEEISDFWISYLMNIKLFHWTLPCTIYTVIFQNIFTISTELNVDSFYLSTRILPLQYLEISLDFLPIIFNGQINKVNWTKML